MNQTNQKRFPLNGTHKKLNQPKMVVANWMRSHRVVWWVSNRPMLHSADIPVSHRAPMNPSWHWHWDAPITLIHVPPFWHGFLLLLAHSSMSEKKTQADASIFFAWFVTFCIIKKLLVLFYIFKKNRSSPIPQTSEPPDELFHGKCGQRRRLHFNLICRITLKTISVAIVLELLIRKLHYLENKAKC